MFTIDVMSRVPVYEQLIKQVEDQVLKGIMKEGDKMPSVRSLSMELSTNPNTIQKAYMELDRRGILVSVPGKGSFISAEALKIVGNQSKEKLSDLKDETFIMLAKNSLLYEPVINLCRKAGFDPKISFVSDRMSSILQMVENKQGVAILMHPQTKKSEVSFVSIKPTLTSTLLFIRNKGNHSKIENDFWNYLKQFEMPNWNNCDNR